MRKLLSFIILLVTLASCTIRFDRFPSNVRTDFPEEMRGKYLFTNRQEKDSTYVTITANTIRFSDDKILRSGGLSDTIKLAKGKSYYYLCFGDSVKNRFIWDVYPMKTVGKKLYFFALDADYYKKPIKKYFKPISGFEDLYEMDEAKLDLFCKKKLKNKTAVKLIKVNP
jgi:hypothetical protein